MFDVITDWINTFANIFYTGNRCAITHVMRFAMTKHRLRLLALCQHRQDGQPCIVREGDGVIDWFIPPDSRHPAGRYRITRIKHLEAAPDAEIIFMEYTGPIPAD